MQAARSDNKSEKIIKDSGVINKSIVLHDEMAWLQCFITMPDICSNNFPSKFIEWVLITKIYKRYAKEKKANYICKDSFYLRHKLWQWDNYFYTVLISTLAWMFFKLKKLTSSKIPPPLRVRTYFNYVSK